MANPSDDLRVTSLGAVAEVEINRPPHNYFDAALLADLAETLNQLADDGRTRAVVLCSAGRSFCAGADFRREVAAHDPRIGKHLYEIAVELFSQPLPMVAAVQGAAVGGGLGLAMAADARGAATRATFVANFTHLGFHPGFGLSASLPWFIGNRAAGRMLVSGTTVGSEEALSLGLADQLVADGDERSAAVEYSEAWVGPAPLAIRATRQTLRAGLVEQVRSVLSRERSEQDRLMGTSDWAEGMAAPRERRRPVFEGQ